MRGVRVILRLLMLTVFTACTSVGSSLPPTAANVNADAAGSFVGVWELVSISTRWPDGRVTEPWGAHPVGRLNYDAQGRMTVLLMDSRRNQANGQSVAPEVQANVSGYFGSYAVDASRGIVTHHVLASLRASESGVLERTYELGNGTLVLAANAIYEGVPVTHTLQWRRGNSSSSEWPANSALQPTGTAAPASWLLQ